jgi:hypothetical protein
MLLFNSCFATHTDALSTSQRAGDNCKSATEVCDKQLQNMSLEFIQKSVIKRAQVATLLFIPQFQLSTTNRTDMQVRDPTAEGALYVYLQNNRVLLRKGFTI